MKTFVITGATSGIGKVTAIEIAKNSTQNQIIFNFRDNAKAEKVKQEIIEKSGNQNIFAYQGDFSSLQSVKNFAEEILKNHDKIDALLNNAGTWEMEFKETIDGIESNFAVNHLAPFLLTNLLLSHLQKSESARIVNTSSRAHMRNVLQLDDLEFRQSGFDGFASYSQSKLCNLLFALQLVKNLKESNISNITVNSLHPGLVKTPLFDKMNSGEKSNFGNFITPEEGAKTLIYLALSAEVEGLTGGYYYLEKLSEPSEMAKNPELAQKLWEISLEYVKKFL